MAGIFKLFLKLKSDIQSIVLTGKSTDCLEGGIVCICSQFSYKVEQFVCLEQKFESAGIDLGCCRDTCRIERLAVFESEGLSVFGQGVCTVEVLSLDCGEECVVFIECKTECSSLKPCLLEVFVQFLLYLSGCNSSRCCL